MRTLCAKSAKSEQAKFILCWFNPHFNNLYSWYWSRDQVLLQAMVLYYKSDLPLSEIFSLTANEQYTDWLTRCCHGISPTKNIRKQDKTSWPNRHKISRQGFKNIIQYQWDSAEDKRYSRKPLMVSMQTNTLYTSGESTSATIYAVCWMLFRMTTWPDLRLQANWCWEVSSRQMMRERWWYCQVADHLVLFLVSTRYLIYLSEYVLFLWLCSTWWCSSNFAWVGLICSITSTAFGTQGGVVKNTYISSSASLDNLAKTSDDQHLNSTGTSTIG